MRYWKAALAFLIAFLLQGSLLNMFSIGGSTPNLLLCLVVIFSFLYDKELYGILYGALFGIIYDICYSYVIGPTAISLVIVAVIVILLRYYANIENIISMAVVSVIAFVSYYIINWVLYGFTGNPIGLGYVLSGEVITIVYSLVVICVLYKVMIKNVVKFHKDRYFI